MNTQFAQEYLTDSVDRFRKMKSQAEGAISQISAEEFFKTLGDSDNSVAIIVKHLAGNFISRWTDFFTTDGEKPDRDRDTEFEIYEDDSKAKILEMWYVGWERLLNTLENIKTEDLSKKVSIRHEEHSVVQAINRQLTHTSYHVGQIVFLAKYIAGEKWKTLSIPKGKTKEYNKEMERKFGEKNK